MNRITHPAMAEGHQAAAMQAEAAPVMPWVTAEEAIGLSSSIVGGVATIAGIGRQAANNVIARSQAHEGHPIHAANEVAAHILQFGGGVALVAGIGLLLDGHRRRNRVEADKINHNFWDRIDRR